MSPPPDHHLIVRDGRIRLSRGPRENGHRPAIDPLFRSAGRAYGERVVGVILSGSLDDGTAGLRFVKEQGGAAVVQDPRDAVYGSMPLSALSHVDADRVVPVREMGRVLCDLLDTPVDAAPVPAPDEQEPDLVEADFEEIEGDPTDLTCPKCSGVLRERQEGSLVRFA